MFRFDLVITDFETLRPGTFRRLRQNDWTSGEEIFITAELWDSCVEQGRSPQLITGDQALFIGVDAGIKHDTGGGGGRRLGSIHR
jgi:hypothetical protein